MRKPLLILGLLWILLATVVLISQLLEPALIIVEWRTETEVNAAGFNLYRANAIEGPYTKINDQLIPGRGSTTSGATYEFVDEALTPGETYYYRLEDVELDNSATQHAPRQLTAPRFSWWLATVAAGSALIGVILIVAAQRRDGARRE